ncbi:hypothetical protein BGZ59_003649 [Podila verticillata]|nr:hypothetical protein BGZ59_003649 [Podila verticillata]
MIKSQRFKLTRILAPHVGALTQEYKEALEYSSDVLRGLHSSIILFHTKVENLDLHHSSAVFHQNMEVKNDLVGDILQRPLLKPKNSHPGDPYAGDSAFNGLGTSVKTVERMLKVMLPHEADYEWRK